jgi:hypothetical protein
MKAICATFMRAASLSSGVMHGCPQAHVSTTHGDDDRE